MDTCIMYTYIMDINHSEIFIPLIPLYLPHSGYDTQPTPYWDTGIHEIQIMGNTKLRTQGILGIRGYSGALLYIVAYYDCMDTLGSPAASDILLN